MLSVGGIQPEAQNMPKDVIFKKVRTQKEIIVLLLDSLKKYLQLGC